MLFGHQNNDTRKSAPEPVPVPQPVTQFSPTLNPLAVDPTTGVSLPVAPDDPSVVTQTSALQPPVDLPPMPPTPTSAPTLEAPELPLPEAPPLPPIPETPVEAEAAPVDAVLPETPIESPVVEPAILPPEPVIPEPQVETLPTVEETMPFEEVQNEPSTETLPITPEEDVNVNTFADDLLRMKQDALAQLTPLVDQLDQTPEEKFRTKMMMIQSSDDQTLIRDAYEAAQAIPDEKVRAQALLDVINEINYFTSSQSNQ